VAVHLPGPTMGAVIIQIVAVNAQTLPVLMGADALAQPAGPAPRHAVTLSAPMQPQAGTPASSPPETSRLSPMPRLRASVRAGVYFGPIGPLFSLFQFGVGWWCGSFASLGGALGLGCVSQRALL
jgi:hypothetical protein